MVDSRNNVLGMITRKDITHHALDEALLRLHSSATGGIGTHDAGPSAAGQRLVSLDQESAIAATERPAGASSPTMMRQSQPGQELEHVAARGSE